IELFVTATPDSKLKNIVISEFALVGFPAVSKARFREALDKRGVRAGDSLLRYSLNELMEKITKSMEEASQNPDLELPWISIRPAGSGKVKFIVSPSYPGCGI